MTALRSDFSSGNPLPASVASDSAASTSARGTVAGASGVAGTVFAVTARCYPGVPAPAAHAAGGSGAGPPGGRAPPPASHSSYAGPGGVGPAAGRPTGNDGAARDGDWDAAPPRGAGAPRPGGGPR